MTTVILAIHLMIAAGLVFVVLLQKSEGGALGIGGGGGGLMSGRGTANFLSRTTAILAAAFFLTSIALTILAQRSATPRSVFDTPAATSTTGTPDGSATPGAPAGRGGLLDRLQGTAPAPSPATPAPPVAPAAPTVPAAPAGPVVPQTR